MNDDHAYGNPWSQMPCKHLARFAVERGDQTVCLACEHDRLRAELEQANKALATAQRLLAQYREDA